MSNPDPGSGSPSATESQADQADASKVAQAATDAHDASELSAAQYKAMLADVRKEAAGYRTRLSAFEKAQAEADAAKLSDLEKANKKAADLEAQLNERTRASQERIINYEIRLAADTLNFVHPEVAVKLLDWSELKHDDEGVPTNALELLQALVKKMPELIAPAGKPSVSSGGATNPSRAAASGSSEIPEGLEAGWAKIQSFSEAEYQARRPEIYAWMQRHPFRFGR